MIQSQYSPSPSTPFPCCYHYQRHIPDGWRWSNLASFIIRPTITLKVDWSWLIYSLIHRVDVKRLEFCANIVKVSSPDGTIQNVPKVHGTLLSLLSIPGNSIAFHFLIRIRLTCGHVLFCYCAIEQTVQSSYASASYAPNIPIRLTIGNTKPSPRRHGHHSKVQHSNPSKLSCRIRLFRPASR